MLEVGESRAAVRGVDRRETRRVGDDEAAAQEWGVDANPHVRGNVPFVPGRVVDLPQLTTDRDEP